MTDSKINIDAHELFKKRKVVIQTLIDRKYDVSDQMKKLPFNDFLELYRNSRHHLYFPPTGDEKEPEEGGGIYVFFEPNEDFTKRVLESRVATIDKEYPNLNELFFVLKSGKAKKKAKINVFVQNAIAKKPEFAHVRILEHIYGFSVTDNVLVPKHRMLSEAEADALMEKYGIKREFLPGISVDDPQMKHFGAELGQVVEVLRGGGQEPYLRYVKNIV